MQKERLFGVNVASLLPYSLGKYGFKRSIKIAVDSGFDGLHILPLRGWNNIPKRGIPQKYIISFQEAWNGGSFISAIRREFKQRTTGKYLDEQNPLLIDWLLFGSWRNSYAKMELFFERFPWAFYSYYRDPIVRRGLKELIELCPELGWNGVRRLQRLHEPTGFVWDVEHITRKGRQGEPPLTKDWRSLLDKLKPEEIKLIHVTTNLHEIAELPEMLRALAEKTSETMCPIILEDKPRITLHPEKWLRERREFLGRYFE